MKRKRISICAAVMVLTRICLAAELELMQPLANEAISNGDKIVAGAAAEPWVVRKARIRLAADFENLCRSVKGQDVLRLGLFLPDATGKGEKTVRIRPGSNAVTNRSGGISLRGLIEGGDIKTAALTISGNRLLGTIEDLKAGRIYQLTGDLEAGTGEVTELDPSKLPPKRYLPPLIPGAELGAPRGDGVP